MRVTVPTHVRDSAAHRPSGKTAAAASRTLKVQVNVRYVFGLRVIRWRGVAAVAFLGSVDASAALDDASTRPIGWGRAKRYQKGSWPVQGGCGVSDAPPGLLAPIISADLFGVDPELKLPIGGVMIGEKIQLTIEAEATLKT